MVGSLYRAHGELCASHPWEVIVGTLTLTACILCMDQEGRSPPPPEPNAIDAIVMTAIRCIAVLYSYHQFCNLHRLRSKYVLGIAGLFTVFSSFVFSSSVIKCLRGDISDLKDALFFFLLLIDLSKATLLAQYALSASNQEEVKVNIARGMTRLGPSLTLDTVVETLVISVGTLSGIKRLEILCYFACMSVLVNFLVFMTFYPACLSLILELTDAGEPGRIPSWHDKSPVVEQLNKEGEEKPNPVVQRVKMIMSGGLVIVHLHSRWALKSMDAKERSILSLGETSDQVRLPNATDASPLPGYLLQLITLSAEHIVVLILVIALTVKFIFFKDKDILNVEHREIEKEATETVDKVVQTEEKAVVEKKEEEVRSGPSRSAEESLVAYKKEGSARTLTDEEVLTLVKKGHVASYQLEKAVEDPERGVGLRRRALDCRRVMEALRGVPYRGYDYSKVMGACCENVVGYVPVPVGLAGPLNLDGEMIQIPMATTEGCLVASTNRGCRALSQGGVTSRLVADGMTRGPVVRFPSITDSSRAMQWIQKSENFTLVKEKFDSTSRFARLTKVHVRIAGRHLFIRFVATTGDAMGMNMTSKGTEVALNLVQRYFPEMEILSLSGNFCADKKPAAVNWIEGRGKSVVCEAVVSEDIVNKVLKTTVHALVDVNISKNLIGSAVAGSVGGFNAHAANVVTAIYIATGQDPAQNVTSSNCMTLMEPCNEKDLYISVTMPSIELGTVGGGTGLPAQAACLDAMGARGAHPSVPGRNAERLARIVCGAVLAGELSLMAALASGHLVKSHLRHNRSLATLTTTTTTTTTSRQ